MILSRQGIPCQVLIAGAIGALAIAAPALAQEATRQSYSIEGQNLADAFRAVSRVSGREIMFTANAVRAKRAPKLVGSFTLEEAISRLIIGTDLIADFRSDAVLIRGRSQPADEPVDRSAEVSDILVTGSRIKGASPTSPVIIVSADTIRSNGFGDLGEAIRALPQNFAGGQNPGVTITASGTNQNVTSGSALNLRGLGADASLTLLNGHRLAYDSSTQAVDISAIPLAAIDRIEIVADGASALYGSDAVGGVANIILKTDFDGLEVRGRFGAATDGGFVQQDYSAVGGHRWSSGAVLATVDYLHSTQVSARQRAYTAAVPDDTTLYPAMDYVSVVGTGHQALMNGVSFDVDGYFSRRRSPVFLSFGAGAYTQDGAAIVSETKNIGVSPSIALRLSDQWQAKVLGTYGVEHGHLVTDYYLDSALYLHGPTRYDNTFNGVEASIDGSLFRLPAGRVRLAAGGGYRTIGLVTDQQVSFFGSPLTTTLRLDRSQLAKFGYGELYIPLVSAENRLPLVYRLSVTAAGRFESYDSFGDVFTPKLGLIYSPTADFDLKGAWGRSFKAPTLRQQSVPDSAILTRASDYAGGYPAAAAVLYTDGGNQDLRAERATTWTATIGFHPDRWRGAKLEISYFDVRYRDRVLAPIGTTSGSLTNPLYRDLVTLAPTRAQIDAVIARSPTGLVNDTSVPFDYANVIAIEDNRYRNVAIFTAKGFDVSASVPFSLDAAGDVVATTSLSYLESAQQQKKGDVSQPRAGTVGNPPHWRMRTGASWSQGGLTITPAVDYIGDVSDNRTAVVATVGSMTMFDLTARYRIEHGGPLRGLDVTLSVQNLFNTRPAPIAVSASYLPAYDSANYSALGRSVSLTVGKRW